MSNKFHPLVVQEVVRETKESVSITFEVPENLKAEFSFISGQYLTLEAEINDENVRRSYSLCSAPYEDVWKVAVKKVKNGKFSTYANSILKKGDILSVMPPAGNFTATTNEKNQNHYLAFVAGSGITPVISIIKSILYKEPRSRFSLFYGNQKVESILFHDALEALKDTYIDRFSVHHILSREKIGSSLFYGRIDTEKCKQYANLLFDPSAISDYYLCGPSKMIFSLKDELISLGIDTGKIHFELFNTSDVASPVEKIEEKSDIDPSAEGNITIIYDQETIHIPLSYNGESILNAGIKAGLDLPFACKGGVCSTCKAKVIEGEVHMDVNYSLEKDEIENNFILTCQSHPRTPNVVVDFDQG